MGHAINKIFLPIDGKPIIIHALEAFEHCALVDEILLVGAKGEEAQLAKLAHAAQLRKVRRIIEGGATRHGSEQCALEALRAEIEAGEIEIILIHDGARPFLPSSSVECLIERTRGVGAAILALPLQEEERVVQVDTTQGVCRSYEGEQIWRAQTPQAFRATLLLQAYDQAARDQFVGTDTAASVERIGYPIAVVESELSNLKITTAHDLFQAEKLSRHRHL
jgi:2-C-methyl-D-erythritol 4-phosphate cytidylyltransferase